MNHSVPNGSTGVSAMRRRNSTGSPPDRLQPLQANWMSVHSA
jgi:hypothetical protein